MGREIDHRPDTRLAWGVGAVVAVAVGAPVVWAWSVADRLPDEVARHWGARGQVTGTWSLGSQLALLSAIAALSAGACGWVAVVGRQPTTIRRMLAGTGVWTATVLAASQIAALAGQLDLGDPFDAPAPGGGLALGAVVGLVLGSAVAALAREPEHGVRAVGTPAPDLPRLAPGGDRGSEGDLSSDRDRAGDLGDAGAAPTWEAAPAASRGLLVVAGVVLVGSALPLVVGTWWPLVIGATVLVPIVGLSRFRVRIDPAGLVARSGPVTLLRVPLDEVAGADVVDHLDPFWEFGGWGLRVDVHGRTGLVSRAGEALVVTRADGSQVVATVDDARGAAATLNTLADLRCTP